MSNRRFNEVLSQWEEKRQRSRDLVSTPVHLTKTDLAKLKALADVYQQPVEDIMADLMHTALQEVESSIPYVPGSKVIRYEDGDPCYEDEGKTPEYLAARQRHADTES